MISARRGEKKIRKFADSKFLWRDLNSKEQESAQKSLPFKKDVAASMGAPAGIEVLELARSSVCYFWAQIEHREARCAAAALQFTNSRKKRFVAIFNKNEIAVLISALERMRKDMVDPPEALQEAMQDIEENNNG